MTPKQEAALRQALEALEEYAPQHGRPDDIMAAITTLREALAEQVQEPVVIQQFRKRGCSDWFDGHPDHTDGGGPYESRTLYTAPLQRKPLTDEEIKPLVQRAMKYYRYAPKSYGLTVSTGFEVLARAIEAAHGITGEKT